PTRHFTNVLVRSRATPTKCAGVAVDRRIPVRIAQAHAKRTVATHRESADRTAPWTRAHLKVTRDESRQLLADVPRVCVSVLVVRLATAVPVRHHDHQR